MSKPRPEHVLVFDGVSKAFGGKPAVRDVSFKVERGEIFGFLGPNGAGKSTTIRMMLDVLRPDGGTIELFGVPNRKVRATHRRMGYLSGDMVIDNNLTGRQYLEFVDGIYGNDCRERRHELAHKLQAELDVKIGNYSRGNRQKIGLIAALQHEPELLVLDEPTSGFDPLVQEAFLELIRMFRDRGGAVFMSSHILSEVRQLCDRVAFIKDGAILMTTAINELTEKAAKRVVIRAAAPQMPEIRKKLEVIPGVLLHAAVEGYEIQCSYAGDIKLLIKLLAGYDVQDLTIKEPEMEEIFMQYYQKPAGKDDAS